MSIDTKRHIRSQSGIVNVVIANGSLNVALRYACLPGLFAWFTATAAPAPATIPNFAAENHRLIPANGLVDLEFDRTHPSIKVTANDVLHDNFFVNPDLGRHPGIEEDESPLARLVSETA